MTSRPIILLALAFAVFIFAVSFGLRYAQNAGLIEAEAARRTMQVLIGLGFAAYANLMPKQLWKMHGSLRAEAWAQRALRVGGWSLALAGLAYGGFWAFAPLAIAGVASKAVLASATAVTIGYALWSFKVCRNEARAAHSNP